jgi:hypothetical protein
MAQILRASQKALANLAMSHDSQLPPAAYRPLRWTEGQVTRFLASPVDIVMDQDSHDAFNVTVRYAMRKLRRDLEAAAPSKVLGE